MPSHHVALVVEQTTSASASVDEARLRTLAASAVDSTLVAASVAIVN
jgi:hypothetical protein